ncbi:hypothetical protein HOG27_05370 [bacterium]|jgi:hypothetical protein|nr:hypothetical protein [bacterium]
MFKKFIITLLFFTFTTSYSDIAYAAEEAPSYTELKYVDNGTFNVHRYRIADEYFNLRSKFNLN